MKTRCHLHFGDPAARCVSALALCVVLLPASLHAQEARKNPSSKVYFSDVNGEAQIDTGDKIEDVTKRSVYSAQGTIIETKKAENEADKAKNYSTMVYSNGTGAFFDSDTRVEVKRFEQEPFIPNRADVEVEPSISQTQAFVAHGTVGLCTSKLVAGSNMNYQTPLGSVNVRGRKVVIEATPGETKISMLEGDSTVRSSAQDVGGQTLHAGEQAVIRSGGAGRPNSIEISKITPQDAPGLDEKVALACAAKKTVYFEVRERSVDTTGKVAASAADTKGDSNTDGTAPSGPVTAFDGNSATTASTTGGNAPTSEIVPVAVVPVNLPVQFTVSPATLVAPASRGPGG